MESEPHRQPRKERAKDKEAYDRDRETRLKTSKAKFANDSEFAEKFKAKARDYYTANREARLRQKSVAYYADVDGKYAAKRARVRAANAIIRDARIAAKAANQV